MVEVISKGDEQDIWEGADLLKRMRAAGVPVIGAVWPRGVEYGTLSTTTDLFGQVVWRWEE